MNIAWNDRGVMLGDGLFETLRIENARPLLFARHLKRLQTSGDKLGLKIPMQQVKNAAEQAIVAENVTSGSLRITVTRGPGPRGLVPPAKPQPTVFATVTPVGPRPSADAIVNASVSTIRRNAGSPTGAMKTLSYLDNVLARQEAESGCDDVIMMNTNGFPACTSIANILVLMDKGWMTPALDLGGVLPGIIREVLIEKAAVQEKELTLADLQKYPLARCNSLVGVQPLQLLGGPMPDLEAIRKLRAALEATERGE